MKPFRTIQVTDWLQGRELANFKSLIGQLGQELVISCFTKIFASPDVYFALIRVTKTSYKNGIKDIMWNSTISWPR